MSDDFDDDYDFDDDDLSGFDDDMDMSFDEEAPSKKRKPHQRIAAGALSELSSLDNAAKQAGVLYNNALPKDLKIASDLVLNAASDARDIYETSKEELKRPIKDLKKSVRRVTDNMNFLPDWVKEKINKVTEVEPEYTSIQQTEESKTAMMIESLFAKNEEDNEFKLKQFEIDQLKSKDEVERSRLSINNQIKILHEVNKLTTYQDKIDYNYKKKTLELSQLSLFALRNTRDILKAYAQDSINALGRITENTSLPDVVKVRSMEVRAAELKSKIYNSPLTTISDKITGLGGQVFGNVKNMVKEKVGAIGAALDSGAMAIGGMADASEMARDMGIDNLETAGSLISGTLQSFLAKKAGAKLRKYIEGSEKWKPILDMGQFTSENLMTLLYEYKNDQNSGYMGSMLNAIMPSITTDTTIESTDISKLGSVGTFTNMTQKTIVNIIPGYLSRMTQYLHMLATGESTERLVYSVETDDFMTLSKATRRAVNTGFRSSVTSHRLKGAIDIVNTLDPKSELSFETRKAWANYISRKASNSISTFRIEDYAKASIMNADPPPFTGASEVASFIRGAYDLDDEGKSIRVYNSTSLEETEDFDNTDENKFNLRASITAFARKTGMTPSQLSAVTGTAGLAARNAELQRTYSQLSSGSNELQLMINNALESNGRDVLLKAGIIKQDKDGKIIVDRDRAAELENISAWTNENEQLLHGENAKNLFEYMSSERNAANMGDLLKPDFWKNVSKIEKLKREAELRNKKRATTYDPQIPQDLFPADILRARTSNNSMFNSNVHSASSTTTNNYTDTDDVNSTITPSTVVIGADSINSTLNKNFSELSNRLYASFDELNLKRTTSIEKIPSHQKDVQWIERNAEYGLPVHVLTMPDASGMTGKVDNTTTDIPLHSKLDEVISAISTVYNYVDTTNSILNEQLVYTKALLSNHADENPVGFWRKTSRYAAKPFILFKNLTMGGIKLGVGTTKIGAKLGGLGLGALGVIPNIAGGILGGAGSLISKAFKLPKIPSFGIGKKASDIIDVATGIVILSKEKMLSGEYRDELTGKAIKSLRDIKGRVLDSQGNIVLDPSKYTKGIKDRFNGIITDFKLNEKGEYVRGKLSSLKKWGKGKADTGSAILHRVTGKLVIDMDKLASGVYIDAITKKPIYDVKDIKGAIIDTDTGELIDIRSMLKDLVTESGKKVKGLNYKGIVSTVAGKVLSAFNFSNRLVAKPFIGAYRLARSILGKRHTVEDVYILGEDKPRLLKIMFDKNMYFNQHDGSPITKFEDIAGTVVDYQGNILIDVSDLKNMVGSNGKPLGGTLIGKIAGKIAKLGIGAAKLALKWPKTLFTLAKSGITKAKGVYNDKVKEVDNHESILSDLKAVEKYGGDINTVYLRRIWMKGLGSKGVFSNVFSGIKGIATGIGSGVKNTFSKFTHRKDDTSTEQSTTERKVRFNINPFKRGVFKDVTTKDLLASLLTKLTPKPKLKGDRDGDGDVDNSLKDRLSRMGSSVKHIFSRKKDKKEDDGKDSSGFGIMSLVGGAAGIIAAIAKVGGILGTVISTLKGGFTTLGGALKLLLSAPALGLSLGKKALGLAGSVVKPVASVIGKTGRLAMGAGKALGSTAVKTAASVVAKGAIGTAARVATGPLGWSALAAEAGIHASFYVLNKQLDAKNIDPVGVEKLRMLMYGINVYSHKERTAIRELEKSMVSEVRWDGNKPMLTKDLKYYAESYAKLFGADGEMTSSVWSSIKDTFKDQGDPAARMNWAQWFIRRFIPIYFTWLNAAYTMGLGRNLDKIESLPAIKFKSMILAISSLINREPSPLDYSGNPWPDSHMTNNRKRISVEVKSLTGVLPDMTVAKELNEKEIAKAERATDTIKNVSRSIKTEEKNKVTTRNTSTTLDKVVDTSSSTTKTNYGSMINKSNIVPTSIVDNKAQLLKTMSQQNDLALQQRDTLIKVTIDNNSVLKQLLAVQMTEHGIDSSDTRKAEAEISGKFSGSWQIPSITSKTNTSVNLNSKDIKV